MFLQWFYNVGFKVLRFRTSKKKKAELSPLLKNWNVGTHDQSESILQPFIVDTRHGHEAQAGSLGCCWCECRVGLRPEQVLKVNTAVDLTGVTRASGNTPLLPVTVASTWLWLHNSLLFLQKYIYAFLFSYVGPIRKQSSLLQPENGQAVYNKDMIYDLNNSTWIPPWTNFFPLL